MSWKHQKGFADQNKILSFSLCPFICKEVNYGPTCLLGGKWEWQGEVVPAAFLGHRERHTPYPAQKYGFVVGESLETQQVYLRNQDGCWAEQLQRNQILKPLVFDHSQED